MTTLDTTTQHEHDARAYELALEDLKYDRCAATWDIVGGPHEHIGPRFVEHIRTANACTLAIVCAAHLPYSLVFLAREHDDAECIELESLTSEREREILSHSL